MSDRKKASHYVDGERMGVLAAEAAKTGEVDDELVEMFYVLARRSVDYYRHFTKHGRRLLDEDDAVQEGVIACYHAALKFQDGRGSAYSFFRTVVSRAYSSLYEHLTRMKRHPEQKLLSTDQLLERSRVEAVSSDLQMDDEQCWADLQTEPTRCLRQDYIYYQSFKKGKPRLTDTQAREILRRCGAGEKHNKVAKDLGIHPSTISKLLKKHRNKQ